MNWGAFVLTVGVVGAQVFLAWIALKTGRALASDKDAQQALPLIALVIAPALTIGTSLTPVVVTLVRSVTTAAGATDAP